MSDLIDDVGAYLAAAGLSLVLGTNLFGSTKLDEPDRAVFLYENGGSPPEYTMGSSQPPQLEAPRLQIINRALTYSEARTDAKAIWALMHLTNATLNGHAYTSIKAVASPEMLEQDHRDRILYDANYEVWKTL